MTSKNGSKELVSLLQYMKDTDIDNPEILVKDERILELDKIVTEVKQSEEWEAVQMNILEIGIKKGEEVGIEKGMEKGIEEGRKEGRAEGEERVNRLIQILLEQSRSDEIQRAVSDKEYQKKLFEEFNL